MNPSVHSSKVPCTRDVLLPRPERRGAFALVLVLIILSLLIVVAVSFLASSSTEHQTAAAFSAKTSAGQAAQAAVDTATAVLAETFRDFPDSATVWDIHQSINSGTNTATISGVDNEGTTMYLRAVPSAAGVANPMPSPSSSPAAANDPKTNNPSNPNCKTFVLPLISGVLNGQAQLVSKLVSNKTALFPTPMNLSVSDPSQQNWTDLNVRRHSGDIQGYIGSPPGWTGTPSGGSGTGPKPARAYWVNVKGNNGVITSRYAYWVEDESFRVNSSFASTGTNPPNQPANPTDSTGKLRSLQASDLMLFGTLTKAGDSNASADTTSIVNTRALYPGSFFPDPLAFSHAFGNTPSTSATQTIDTVRYLTTNQSGTLNLTRHGTQRLNLNSLVYPSPTPSSPSAPPVTQAQIDALVQTMEFHLPYFGQRFYRTNTTTVTAASLNDATQVPNSPTNAPTAAPVTVGTSNAQIYYYKVVANIFDYIDADTQPTFIMSGGQLAPAGKITVGLEDPIDGEQTNEFWAQGKESTPLIQEAAVHYQPVVTTSGNATPSKPKGYFDLKVDYYIEFWNMTDRDIYATPPSASLPNLGSNPAIWVRYQQPWQGYPLGDAITGSTMTNNQYPPDMEISLAGTGVIFRAGAVTVITTDPQYANYTYAELTQAGGQTDPLANTNNVYYCPNIISGSREYTGMIYNGTGKVDSNDGLAFGNQFSTANYSGTEVSLVNDSGYLDVARGAITKTGGPPKPIYFTNTDTKVSYPPGGTNYNNFSFGSSLLGNKTNIVPTTPSQLGDPRTNNEQLSIIINPGDPPAPAPLVSYGTRFVPSTRTLGSPNWSTLYPSNPAGMSWPDYYFLPAGVPTTTNADATTAPAVIADAPLTSIGQLGDVFDPARVPGTADIRYSRGGGRTLKIGDHDDLYSTDPTGSASGATTDNVSASNGWAAWRLTDIFDISDAIEQPARININGVQRDAGAALLALLQGFIFQGPTSTSPGADPIIHGDYRAGSAVPHLASLALPTTGTANGFSQIVAQMTTRLNSSDPTKGPTGPFFERGELGELGSGTSALFGSNPPLYSDPTNNTLVPSVDMNKTTDHGREELFRRIAQMICTRGDTFTVYAVGESIVQPANTTAANADTAAKKVTGTQRMRVTFRLVPKIKNATTGLFDDFHPAYTANTDGTVGAINPIDTKNPSGQYGVTARFAKPDRYDIQVLQATVY